MRNRKSGHFVKVTFIKKIRDTFSKNEFKGSRGDQGRVIIIIDLILKIQPSRKSEKKKVRGISGM